MREMDRYSSGGRFFYFWGTGVLYYGENGSVSSVRGTTGSYLSFMTRSSRRIGKIADCSSPLPLKLCVSGQTP